MMDGNEQVARRRPGGVFLAGILHRQPPAKETTADRLVRVPSRSEGGVYRDLDVDFTRYKRLMIEPLTVEFLAGWRKQHPDISNTEVRRIQLETAADCGKKPPIFIDEGPFELAEVREPTCSSSCRECWISKFPAPETELDTGYRSYSPRAISMQMTGELRDGVNGEILLRVIMIDGEYRYKFSGKARANRVPMRMRSAAALKDGHAWSERQSTWP